MLLLQVLLDGLVFGSIYALGALGFSLIYGTTGTFHIAFGATLMVAVYLATEIGLSGSQAGIGFLVGAVLAMVIGVITYLAFYRPIEAKGRSRVLIFVASLGLTTMIEAAILMIFGEQNRTYSLGSLTTSTDLLGKDISPLGMIAIGLAAATFVGSRMLLEKTSFGRKVKGISMNRELAETIGVSTTTIVSAVYALGSLAGFVALFILSANGTVTSEAGTSFTLIVAVAVIAGGVGSLTGSYLVAMAFGLIQSLTAVYISGQWTLVMVYGLFILLMMVRPSGLFRGLARS